MQIHIVTIKACLSKYKKWNSLKVGLLYGPYRPTLSRIRKVRNCTEIPQKSHLTDNGQLFCARTFSSLYRFGTGRCAVAIPCRNAARRNCIWRSFSIPCIKVHNVGWWNWKSALADQNANLRLHLLFLQCTLHHNDSTFQWEILSGFGVLEMS